MLWASLFFAGMNLCIKFLPHIPTSELVFFRAIITLILSYFTLLKLKISPWGNNKKLLIFRGLAGFVGLSFYFYTVQNMPLATAVTIQYLSPIFSTILAIFILKENVRKIQWLLLAISFVGVALIKGFDNRVSIELLIIGITSAFFSGLAYNIIGKLRGQDHPMVIVFYFPLVTVPAILPFLIYQWETPELIDWIPIIGMGVCTQFAQLYMTKAYLSENVASVSIINYVGIVYALILGAVFFGEYFSLEAIIGMGLVLLGVLLSVMVKARRIQQEKKMQVASGSDE